MGLGSETLATEVNHLLAGRLVIPSIQRGFVWQGPQVPLLLDSLYRNYPIGSLLVWNTNIDVPLKKAAVLQEEEVQLRPGVLLDGQQRLTSLAKVMAPERVSGRPLDVRFDLDNEVFLNASAADRRRPRLVSVTQLLGDSPQFGQILSSAGVSAADGDYDELYSRLRQVHEIRRYEVPITTIDTDDYETVAEIFARVNQGGRRLSKGDLVHSAIAARWSDGLDVIDAFNDRLDRLNFSLDREAVLRLTGLLAGSGAHVIKLIGKDVTGDDLKRAWHDTERALSYAVDFLRAECGIPRSGVLSSPNVVIIPAYLLFRRGNRLPPEEREGLRRWVYTAMAFSYYSNTVEGKLDYDARLVRERSGAQLVDALMRRASGPRSVGAPIEPSDLESKKSTSSFFNLLYIAALQARARDWHSGQPLSAAPMSSDSKIEYHHIFPKAQVLKRYDSGLVNQIANLAFISGDTNRKIAARSPAEYLLEVDEARLQEQWIPQDDRAWNVDQFPEFLDRRRELLAEVLNDLLSLDTSRLYPAGSDAEVPHEDEEIDIESRLSSSSRARVLEPVGHSTRQRRTSGTRRSVGQHVAEVFAATPIGRVLSIREVAEFGSTQYGPREISHGAIAALMDRGDLPPGLEEVAGMRPRSIRRRGAL